MRTARFCGSGGVYPTPTPDTLSPRIPFQLDTLHLPDNRHPTPNPHLPPKGHGARDTLPPFPMWTEWQTPVKTLPSRNFVGGR